MQGQEINKLIVDVQGGNKWDNEKTLDEMLENAALKIKELDPGPTRHQFLAFFNVLIVFKQENINLKKDIFAYRLINCKDSKYDIGFNFKFSGCVSYATLFFRLEDVAEINYDRCDTKHIYLPSNTKELQELMADARKTRLWKDQVFVSAVQLS